MKLEGRVAETTVVILIDSGATNNFVSSSTAKRLGQEISKCKPFEVTLGAGSEVFREGICRRVPLWVQGMKFFDEFFVLELGTLDFILGV